MRLTGARRACRGDPWSRVCRDFTVAEFCFIIWHRFLCTLTGCPPNAAVQASVPSHSLVAVAFPNDFGVSPLHIGRMQRVVRMKERLNKTGSHRLLSSFHRTQKTHLPLPQITQGALLKRRCCKTPPTQPQQRDI